MRFAPIVLLALALLTAGCAGSGTDAVDDGIPENPNTNARGLDRKNLDESVSPCDDFYRYANGSWMDRNPIPADQATWGIGNEMQERNYLLLRSILDEAADAGAAKGTNKQKVGDFWRMAMDTDTIEKQGLEPLQADLDRIAAASSADDILGILTDWHREGASVLFGFAIFQDLRDTTQYIGYAVQGGLGLPDRDYYTREDEESAALRDKYRNHVARMLSMAGSDEAAAATQADAIMALETRLAEASLTNVEMRNPATYYNVQPVDYANTQTPRFNWTGYLQAMDLGELETFSYAHPKFFAEMNAALGDTDLDTWKAYLRWHLIDGFAPYLSDAFVQANFDWTKELSGAEELRPRWKRAIDQTSGSLGEALGEVYVERAFPPATKQKADEMIENLRASIRSRIEQLEWMTDETRGKALNKLESFVSKIGYPDEWRDYSPLSIGTDSYVANVRAANAFEAKRNRDKIGQPIDRNEWGMAPQVINAYYNPVMTEIVFPAAIMQPPFFDGEMDDAVNYGAMGAVIGHEFMHGFDDQGSRFDADGNMKNWWSDADRAAFEERTARLVAQYNGMEALEGLNVDGQLTLGENIGDLAGVTMAYYALQKALEQNNPGEIDGFTPEQRFFLAWAQSWRRNYRDEALKLQVNTDVHSPSMFRTNGPLANMPEFAAAFGCKDSDAMVLASDLRADIW